MQRLGITSYIGLHNLVELEKNIPYGLRELVVNPKKSLDLPKMTRLKYYKMTYQEAISSEIGESIVSLFYSLESSDEEDGGFFDLFE